MRVVFRADASFQIGTGHVMRCLTFAEELRKSGAECIFVCRAHAGNLNRTIADKGFAVRSLTSLNTDGHRSADPHSSWLGVSWREDASDMLNILSETPVNWLIVDNYALDERWEEKISKPDQKIFVIDDLANRSHNCDVLLDQNLGRHARDYDDLVPPHCQRLIGAHYALLRPEFAALRNYSLKRRVRPELKNILISLGGIDQSNATLEVLKSLKNYNLEPDVKIKIVLGENAPWIDEVKMFAATLLWQTTVLVEVSNMAQLMADCDLAIGAPGSTSWERCCLGVPTILVIIAKNQETNAMALARVRVARVIAGIEKISYCLPELLDFFRNSIQLQNFSNNSAAITDGYGSLRAMENIK
jgi:UDP-2,4-diacetamido-2,4,6-trideoxy-beta-L-altropyranose hydrolase